mgnify:FL=1
MLDSGDVMTLFRMSKTTLWRHVKEGKFPEPVYVGRSPLWNQKRVEAWLEEKLGDPKPNRERDIDELA